MNLQDSIIKVSFAEATNINVKLVAVDVVPPQAFVAEPARFMQVLTYDSNRDGVVDEAAALRSGSTLITALAVLTHLNNAVIHRTINDAGTSTTDLFSASRILSLLSGKSDIGHTHTELAGYSGTFASGDLDGSGNLTVVHNLNSRKVRPIVLDSSGESVIYSYQVIDANTVKLILAGLVISGTWEILI